MILERSNQSRFRMGGPSKELTALWNIRRLRAVSNESRDLRRRKIKTDHDQFWLDSGGRLETGGNIAFPVFLSPRESATIKPNKRATYRHRCEMLAGVASQIRQNAGCWPGDFLSVKPCATTPSGNLCSTS